MIKSLQLDESQASRVIIFALQSKPYSPGPCGQRLIQDDNCWLKVTVQELDVKNVDDLLIHLTQVNSVRGHDGGSKGWKK